MVGEIQESSLVLPCEETPKETIWLSNLDLVFGHWHSTNVTLYRHNGDLNFFNIESLKLALAKALVPFYPFAGRVVFNKNGRPEIRCTGEGVRFIVARSGYTIDDLVPPTVKHREMVPRAESIDEPPFDMLKCQVTFLKCGGVSLGITMHHVAADGVAAIHFMSTWSDIARGISQKSLTLCIDRTVLQPRSPPTIIYNLEREYHHIPKTSIPNTEIMANEIFKITKEQLYSLKNHFSNTLSKPPSSFKAVAAFVWRCICKARCLNDDDETIVHSIVDIRNKIIPRLPENFFANAVVRTSAKATAGEILGNSLQFAVDKITEAVVRVNDEYVRSAVDFLEAFDIVKHWKNYYFTPRGTKNSIYLVSWLQMPLHGTDFGWGKPTFMSKSHINLNGSIYLMRNSEDDGGITILVALDSESMTLFKNVFFDDLNELSN